VGYVICARGDELQRLCEIGCTRAWRDGGTRWWCRMRCGLSAGTMVVRGMHFYGEGLPGEWATGRASTCSEQEWEFVCIACSSCVN
jgi:hypothetical protein